jgi:hypothetical protein
VPLYRRYSALVKTLLSTSSICIFGMGNMERAGTFCSTVQHWFNTALTARRESYSPPQMEAMWNALRAAEERQITESPSIQIRRCWLHHSHRRKPWLQRIGKLTERSRRCGQCLEEVQDIHVFTQVGRE